MGSAFEFILIAEPGQGEDLLNSSILEVKRLEELLTEFKESSQTSMVNQAAGIELIRVDEEVYQLIKRCKEISRLTQGSFDITAAAFRGLYHFKQDDFEFPTLDSIKERRNRVGYEKISLYPDNHVMLNEKGMRIGFGGIGKGYAADRVKKILLENGVENGVINASGDLTAWGKRLDGKSWQIAIADPDNKKNILAWVPIVNSTVATSGDYEHFFVHNGVRYSHTIDPKSGLPVKGVKSVTIVSPSAELSDALATAVFVMGPDTGIHLVNQLPQTHAIVIDDKNKVFTSKKLNLNLLSKD